MSNEKIRNAIDAITETQLSTLYITEELFVKMAEAIGITNGEKIYSELYDSIDETVVSFSRNNCKNKNKDLVSILEAMFTNHNELKHIVFFIDNFV